MVVKNIQERNGTDDFMKNISISIIALLGLVFVSGCISPSGIKLFSSIGLDSAVFCNIYEFQSCNYHLDGVAQDYVEASFLYITPGHDFRCLSDRCTITNIVNSNTQGIVTIDNGGQFVLGGNLPYTLNVNQTLRTNGARIDFQYNVLNRRLVWCGASACDAAVSGTTVIGSSRCSFVTDKSIYDKVGNLIQAPSGSSISYTVQPTDSVLISNGQQFICGTKFNQCNIDTDCSVGHTYLYNSLGAEAYAGQLQIYGCVNRGTAPTQDQLNALPGLKNINSTAFNYGAKCEVKSTQAVQCIPGTTTCGSNAVCDVSTFTCKNVGNVGCTQNADCGNAQVYDPSTKGFYQYACVANSCQRQLIKTVQCAYNYECPSNWYCDIDNTCKEYTLPKQPAPGVCSVGDPRYFDKPPPPGNICCPGGNEFEPTLAQCQNNPNSCSLLNIGACFSGLFGFLGGLGQWIIIIFILFIIYKFIGSKKK